MGYVLLHPLLLQVVPSGLKRGNAPKCNSIGLHFIPSYETFNNINFSSLPTFITLSKYSVKSPSGEFRRFLRRFATAADRGRTVRWAIRGF